MRIPKTPKKLLHQVLAKAYTHKENSHKELDSELIESMAKELIPFIDNRINFYSKKVQIDITNRYLVKQRVKEL